MKRAAVLLMAVLLLTGTCWASEKEKHGEKHEKHFAKSRDVTLTGQMSCTFCTLPSGQLCSKECCTNCLRSGDPVLFTDTKGHLYLLVSGEKQQPLLTPDRMNLISERINVTGTMVQRDGIKAIYVRSMQRAM